MKIIGLVGLAIYFVVLLFAVTREKKNENIEDFFFGKRSLSSIALAITFVASWWGAGSALSTADLAYQNGLSAFLYYGAPVLISTFLMILAAKKIRAVGYLTQGKMMEARYNKAVAKMLSLMILTFMVINAASQMVGVGDFFGSYLGISYEWAIVLGTSIVLVYSMFGGFRAVVLTDIIQFILLTISALLVFVVAMYYAGGWSGISQEAQVLDKPGYMNLWTNASTYFVYIVTFGCSWMIQANVWQRISAAKNKDEARKMTIISFFVYIPLYLIVVLTGMAGLVLFPDGAPNGGVVSAITMNYMPILLGAFVFVGISAAIMSTMDSLINTAAMTIAIDLTKEKTEASWQLKISRIATVLVTVVAFVIAVRIRSILAVSWIASDVITTGAFVPLVGGFFWRRGNSKGAMSSMAFGLVFSGYNLLISLGIPLPSFWQQASATQMLLGVGVASILYIGVSLLTEPEYQKADQFIALSK
ncbi:solute:Na+ symporter, SSS family [Granulicatella balaenopterae]|uniref:Solute:Na+ symporter, SSS family n=1 Tax=Granulicatella balaenopterae TaxID=137733 RepID=A0A1H9P941_9LACT|nr:sodium:solute symporter family protein [Granulicatella balaenopterae]SER44621.1 solute:Na+ symporter, SSS family [Granulicatella balaenopterae]